ncbi:PWWP domain-containing protein 2A [Limanda limanda]|uniref:PWWP domain-containing protein 2A n=1 Tax=Limanda limanda TaxID=27771 RepID=UPI0029C66ED5|nr:PWWP domain-containing protein 2A [Limanda limanda]
MAAVAAEPGAAAISTGSTAAMDDEGPPEPGPGPPGAEGPRGSGPGPRGSGPAAERRAVRVEDGGDGEERRHVGPELEPAAGRALCEDELVLDLPGDRISLDRISLDRVGLDRVGLDRVAPGLPGDPGSGHRSILPDPQPSAVSLHSVPAPPPGTEAGLSLAEPAVPTTNVTTDRTEAAGRDRGFTVPVQPELRPGPAEDALSEGTADRLSGPGGPVELDRDTGFIRTPAGSEEPPGRDLRDSPPPCRSPKRRLLPDKQEEPGPLASFQDLSPGSEVRVCLDHVIDDALVVSFRRGEQVFSGVLMDVSRRFGPYGIPITVFPKRDDKSPLQTFLQSGPAANDQTSTKQEQATVSPPAPPPHHPWTAKPPPLFQEGAPYPPPLFIRDTYNQALPQPLPRKIKRPKRRYRCEEPTSIMNAIKLRPRQVLCDKCKGVVASGGNREARRVDLRGEEASRRRRAAEGPISSEVKRLRSDDKGGRMATERRASSGTCMSSSPRRVLRGVASSSSSSSSPGPLRLKLNSKKALAKDSASDRSKARQVLQKLARSAQPPAHREPRAQSPIQDRTKAVTRAAALQNHNQKVHFTRRLQHLSGAAGSSSSRTPLPPRMRLKPQRYRTDDNQAPPPTPPKQGTRSSPLKPALNPAPTSDLVPPSALPFLSQASPPSTCAVSVVMETHEVCIDQGGGRGGGEGPPPAPPSSSSVSSLDSSHSEGGSSETFEPPPTGDPPSLPSLPSPDSLAPLSPPSSSPTIPPLRSDSEEPQVGGGEEDEEGGEVKRRRKSSTSSSSSSSSSSPSVFSKSVSRCPLPDGRTVCVGDIVWAKIYGFPWWPARVLGITVVRRGDTGLAVRQEARVSWFGSPTTSFLPLAQLSPFLETFQSRFDRKRKGPYRRAIAEAASAAKQLTPEVRALLTQFET